MPCGDPSTARRSASRGSPCNGSGPPRPMRTSRTRPARLCPVPRLRTNSPASTAGFRDPRPGGFSSPLFRSGLEAQRRALLQEKDRIEGQLRIEAETAQFKTATAERKALSLEVEGSRRDFDTFLEQSREAEKQLVKIRKLMSSPEGQGSVENLSVVQRYLEALEQSNKTRLTGEQRIRAETELQVRQTLARTVAEQASIAADRERLSLAGQVVDAREREARIQGQIAQLQAQAAREARDALRSANDNAATAGLCPIRRLASGFSRRCVISASALGCPRRSALSPAIVRSARSWSPHRVLPRRQRVALPAGPVLRRQAAAVHGRDRGDQHHERPADLRRAGEALCGEAAPCAPPGRSNHETGLAADLAFATPAARTAAHARAAEFGLSFPLANRARNPEPWHIEPIGAPRGMARSTADITSNTQATLANVEAQKLNALNREMVDGVLQRSKMELQNQNQLLDLQEQAMGKTTAQIARASKEQELLNGFFQQGVPLTADLRSRVAELADAYGRTAERGATMRLRQDLQFEREQIFRSDVDRGFMSRTPWFWSRPRLSGSGCEPPERGAGAGRHHRRRLPVGDRLRGFTGQAWCRHTPQLCPAADRPTHSDCIEQPGALAFGFGFRRWGRRRRLPRAVRPGRRGAPGMPLNILPSAYGNVFGGGALSAFSNSIVSSPTIFPFAKGVGLMGEAGPEAIMPLKRTPDGRLGVTAAPIPTRRPRRAWSSRRITRSMLGLANVRRTVPRDPR